PTYAEGKLFTADGAKGMVCLDPDTHAVLWRFDFSTYLGYVFEDGVCNPAYDGGYLYFYTRTGHFFCLKSSDGSCQWHVYQKSWHQNSVLLSDKYVYANGFGGELECRDRLTGNLVWQDSLPSMTDGNLATCGNMLIVPQENWRVLGVNMNN